MVGTDREMLSPGDCNSPLLRQSNLKNHNTVELPLLGSQSSIYSLTLDEFQHTLFENGKNFGSMNMDEFINSIWTAEENQALAQAHTTNPNSSATVIHRQPSNHIQRQVSLSVPEPLCRKTVDEVWSDIHNNNNNAGQNHVQRQTTFGEMTLEDFLVRAGIVREQNNNNNNNNNSNYDYNYNYTPVVPQQPPFGTYQNSNNPVMAPQVLGVGIGSPVSPVSSDGVCPANQVESGNRSSLDTGVLRVGRKRILDGPVHKVVERRQRRMIKNRESAARSRARKQAYTVELEGELNQLKEENALLKHALADLEWKRKQQYYEASRIKLNVQTKAEKANKRLRSMRRSSSGPC